MSDMSDREESPKVLPVIEEHLEVETNPVKTGSVRVEKHVERRVRKIDVPVVREEVEIRRVPINRVVEAAPAIRRSGDSIIIPVVEEQLITTKQVVLKEEVHVIRRRTRERVTKETVVERERAEVKRLDAKGRTIDNAASHTPAIARRRSILE